MFTCVGGMDVSLRDVTIAQIGNGATVCGWRRAQRILGILKSHLVELSPALEEDGWLSFARRGLATGAYEMEGRWKRKNVYLSPYVEEPLNSKVITSFIPELRSRKCFLCFKIPMFYVYVMKILCTFRIAISWLRNIWSPTYL